MKKLTPYEQTIRELSERIVKAQKPIQILDAIKWDHSIQEAFFKHKFKKLPPVDAAYYQKRPLAFDPRAKKDEFEQIILDTRRKLGQFNPLAKIMERMCREYCDVIRMLESRGLSEFPRLSQQLYGSSSDVFHAGDPSLSNLADMIFDTLAHLDKDILCGTHDPKILTSEQAIKILQERLGRYFKGAKISIVVKLSDGIISDAAAGADYIKLRKEAKFNDRDIRLMEVHEGWVHVGTTLNGMEQPICTFLSKGTPSSTLTQEGLAIITEVFNFASYPDRIRRLTNRIRAINMAENGANFIEVFNYFREQGFDANHSYNHTTRIFRGSLPNALPFTKDLVYSKGFVLIYNYIRLAVRRGVPNRIPLLFCGKTTLEDMRTFSDLLEEGILTQPKFLPPQFKDLSALAAWMCFSNFLNSLDLKRIESDYSDIL